jgi:hypothetical protein
MDHNPIQLTSLFNNKGTPKRIPQGLQSVLANLDPEDDQPENPCVIDKIKAGKNKIYLGQAACNPETSIRYPFWLPTDLLSSHMFIGGAIGSGKTTVLFRLISGALKWYGTVIVCEAKGGINGTQDGAAFTDLAHYLHQKWPQISFYRWPRGNCYFNPLEHLDDAQNRRDFFLMIGQIVTEYYRLDGETAAVVFNAATISEHLLLFLQEFVPDKTPTLRELVRLLSSPDLVNDELSKVKEAIKLYKDDSTKAKSLLIESIEYELTMSNFFHLKTAQLVLTRRGVQLFKNILNHEDLLTYTEPNPGLAMLTLDDILYHRSLVILSQPISKKSSAIIGPLFLDSILIRVVESGPSNPHIYPAREKILAILDETHRLPVGSLGEAGDFLREYSVGLVEVAPTISDNQIRWEQNKHVYQTILSLSPGIPTLANLIHQRLPNLPVNPVVSRFGHSPSGISKVRVERRDDYNLEIGIDNPGIASRSLQVSGRVTGLLQSPLLHEERKLFWIDFEDELLANIKTLLKQALRHDATPNSKNLVDYALGLDEFKISNLLEHD